MPGTPSRVTSEHPDQASEHDDERASGPPAGGEGEGAQGPLGNPDVDEEALSQGQQEAGRHGEPDEGTADSG